MSDQDIQIDEDSVRDCLAHLYDYPFLQEHPFVRLLVPHSQANANRVQIFQNVIFDAIDRLKPLDSANPYTKSSRLYNILHLRYQKQHQVQYVLKQLILGERQFYRDHTKAVQVLARVLDAHLKEGVPSATNGNAISIHSELERVQRQKPSVSTSVDDFLRKTLLPIGSLSDRQQIELRVQHCDDLLPGSLDQTLLRQTIIWIVSQLVVQSPGGSCYTIIFEPRDSSAQFTFVWQSLTDPTSVALAGQHLFNDRQETLETLLSALGATVAERVNDGQNTQVFLEIPLQQHSVLIIDDNPDVIGLFRQFLTGQRYQLFTAYEGTQAIELARETDPDFIILDVLLPNQDGWEILQQLKNHPATMDKPVLICSVLDVKDLAVLLGADGFLHKPPEENEFLEALMRFGE